MNRYRQGFRRIAMVIVIAMIPFLATGCYDRQELEQQAFVSVLGIDKAPGGLIDCTFRFAQPVNPTGTSSQAGSEPLAGKESLTVRAHTINEATVLASSSVERSITFTHLSFLLFGSELAKQGISPYLQTLTRYREFRRTVPFAVSQEKAQEIMASMKPMMASSISKIADGITMESRRTGMMPPCRLQDLITSMEVPHQDTVAPLYSINHYVSSKDSSLPDGAKVSYQAGDIPRKGGNPVDWMGGGVFRGDKLVDMLSGEDVFYLRLLQGGMDHAKVELNDPNHPKQKIGLMLHKEGAARIFISLHQPMRVRILMPIDVDVVNIASGHDYTTRASRLQLQKSLSAQVDKREERLLHRLLVTDQADVIPLSQHIRGQFGTYRAFANYPWYQSLKKAKVTVQSDVQVRRFGVQIEPLQTTV